MSTRRPHVKTVGVRRYNEAVFMEAAQDWLDAHRNVRGEFVCTEDAPWRPEFGTPAIHPSAKLLYTDDAHLDTADRRECPWCHVQFWVEVPA